MIRDEVGEYPIMLMDRRARDASGQWRQVNALSALKEKHPKGLAKDSIIVCYGSKGDDILFCNRLDVIDERIYMKLSDLKN